MGLSGFLKTCRPRIESLLYDVIVCEMDRQPTRGCFSCRVKKGGFVEMKALEIEQKREKKNKGVSGIPLAKNERERSGGG